MSWGTAEFLREDMIEASPMIWLIHVDGLIVDARGLPLPVQAQAFELGVIPYIPSLGRDGTAAWLSESRWLVACPRCLAVASRRRKRQEAPRARHELRMSESRPGASSAA